MKGPHAAANTTDKAKNFKSSIKSLLKYIKPYYIAILISLIFAAIGAAIAILCPEKIGTITTEVGNLFIPGIGFINFDFILTTGLILVAFFVTSYICTTLQSVIMTSVTQKVAKSFRTDISKKINRLPLSYFDSRSYGDVLSRVTNDVDTIAQSLSQSVSQLITSFTLFVGVIIMMFTINWKMALVGLCSIPLTLFLIPLVVKHSQKYFKRQQDSLGEMNGHIEEIYSAHNVVKVFNGEKDAINKFDNINKSLHKSAYKSQFLSGLMFPVMGFVGNIVYIAICVLGGFLAINEGMDIGVISSFLIYVKLLNQPLSQMATIASTLQSTAAASERVFEFLHEKEEEDESDKTLILDNIKGEVEFNDVSFGYTQEKEIIHDFSCSVKPGQKIAIVGPTGAGKTTLVNLLMRFYEINSGSIKIDGVNIQTLTRHNVRKLFGMVLQDTWLFEGTIMENLRYANENATDQQIIEACKAADVDHFIRTLPGGYDHYLDDNSSISQGQKQLLTIARAMVEDAPMLILDEATSSVDTRTEILIQEAMDKLQKGRTSFVIAHRLSTIKNADIILVMKDGNIIEKGNHKMLLEQNGFYASLYNSQFSKMQV